jgi:hypothetical protein
VDRQIEQLRMQGKVHVFKLGTGAYPAFAPPAAAAAPPLCHSSSNYGSSTWHTVDRS